MNCCAICGRAVRSTFWTCATCAKDYGLTDNYASWPVWAKELVNSEARERRYQQREAAQLPHSDTLRTRPETVDGLPSDPYDDTNANAAYRRANGIGRNGKH